MELYLSSDGRGTHLTWSEIVLTIRILAKVLFPLCSKS